MRPFFARLHSVLAWLIFLGCALLLYLIALAFFSGQSAATHGAVGRILFILSLLMLIASLVCRSGRLNIDLSILVPVLLFAQGMFVYIPSLPPAGRAIHALNGLMIMGISYLLAHGRARATLESDRSTVVGLAGD